MSLQTGTIVGIVVGPTIGGIGAAVLLVLGFRRYRRRTSPPPKYEPKDFYNSALPPRRLSRHELPTAVPKFSTLSNTAELPV